MRLFYACEAGIKGGIARCLNNKGQCPSHREDGNWTHAPQPDDVFTNFGLNDQLCNVFVGEGVNVLSRTYEDRRAGEAVRVMRAEELGRNAYGHRIETAKECPESATDGCNVVSNTSKEGRTDGLKDAFVGLGELFDELRQAGFHPSSVNVVKMEGKLPKLEVVWSKDQAEVQLPLSFSRFATKRIFNVVHLHANGKDPRKGNRVVHAMNCYRPKEAPAKTSLHFANGDWEVQLVGTSATAA